MRILGYCTCHVTKQTGTLAFAYHYRSVAQTWDVKRRMKLWADLNKYFVTRILSAVFRIMSQQCWDEGRVPSDCCICVEHSYYDRNVCQLFWWITKTMTPDEWQNFTVIQLSPTQLRNLSFQLNCHSNGEWQNKIRGPNAPAEDPNAKLKVLENCNDDDACRPTDRGAEATTPDTRAELLKERRICTWHKCKDVNEGQEWISASLTEIRSGFTKGVQLEDELEMDLTLYYGKYNTFHNVRHRVRHRLTMLLGWQRLCHIRRKPMAVRSTGIRGRDQFWVLGLIEQWIPQFMVFVV